MDQEWRASGMFSPFGGSRSDTLRHRQLVHSLELRNNTIPLIRYIGNRHSVDSLTISHLVQQNTYHGAFQSGIVSSIPSFDKFVSQLPSFYNLRSLTYYRLASFSYHRGTNALILPFPRLNILRIIECSRASAYFDQTDMPLLRHLTIAGSIDAPLSIYDVLEIAKGLVERGSVLESLWLWSWTRVAQMIGRFLVEMLVKLEALESLRLDGLLIGQDIYDRLAGVSSGEGEVEPLCRSLLDLRLSGRGLEMGAIIKMAESRAQYDGVIRWRQILVENYLGEKETSKKDLWTGGSYGKQVVWSVKSVVAPTLPLYFPWEKNTNALY